MTTRLCLVDACSGWADGGRWFFTCGPDGRVQVCDARTGELIRSIPLAAPISSRAAVSPDGRLLAVASFFTPDAEVFDLKTGRRLAAWRQKAGVLSIAWHPTRPWVLTGTTGSEVREVPSGKLLREIPCEGHHLAAFSEDGSAAIFSGWNGMTVVVDTESWQNLVSINGGSAALSPGGLLGNGHPASRYLELATPSLCRSLPKRNIDLSLPGDFSPDGRLLALAGGDGVCLTDLSTHTPVAELSVGYSESVRFSRSGDALYTYSNRRGLDR